MNSLNGVLVRGSLRAMRLSMSGIYRSLRVRVTVSWVIRLFTERLIRIRCRVLAVMMMLLSKWVRLVLPLVTG